jgi:hypothetical protein
VAVTVQRSLGAGDVVVAEWRRGRERGGNEAQTLPEKWHMLQ